MAAVRPTALIPFPQGTSPIPRPIPAQIMALSLAASVAESFTLPTVTSGQVPARYVVFSCTSNYYVNCYATATVPGDTTDGTASELNPSGYQINPTEPVTISVISAVACVITAAFYA